jgi:hypothetical protein
MNPTWYERPSGKIDARLFTTPLGAIAGVALARKLIPEKDKKLFPQALGGGIGAGVGYFAGDLINEHRETPADNDIQGWTEKRKREILQNGPDYLTPATAEELKASTKIFGDTVNLQPIKAEDRPLVLRNMAEPLARYQDASLKYQAAQQHAKKVGLDTPEGQQWSRYAKHWQANADAYRQEAENASSNLTIAKSKLSDYFQSIIDNLKTTR